MDEKDNSTKPKRTRVLRVTDVIPPFDKLPDGAAVNGNDRESSERADPRLSDNDPDADRDIAAGITPDVAPPLVADAEIPKYDLAENILAEQRRVAARRRRSPSQAQEQPVVVPQSSGAKPSLAELPAEDLPELQRIVAEIVARDIDRLCRRPTR
ncbi:MAG: hypothetical protein ABFE13_06560 [Phycisphaerales bacterium]